MDALEITARRLRRSQRLRDLRCAIENLKGDIARVEGLYDGSAPRPPHRNGRRPLEDSAINHLTVEAPRRRAERDTGGHLDPDDQGWQRNVVR